jgi:hypothetical protein
MRRVREESVERPQEEEVEEEYLGKTVSAVYVRGQEGGTAGDRGSGHEQHRSNAQR